MKAMGCVAAATLLTIAVATAAPASAQGPPPAPGEADCGDECRECPGNGHEGYDHNEMGLYDMGCYENIPNCVKCDYFPTDDSVSADILAKRVVAGSQESLAGIIEEFGDRLLINETAHAIVVLGEACEQLTVQAVTFTSAARIQALARLGVETLGDFAAND